ncbi:uncharacterized protein ACN427_002381 isoform 5-T5 [Glossina fuscipes fuscipes]
MHDLVTMIFYLLLILTIMLIMRSLFNSACAKPKNERSFQYQRQVIRTIRIGSRENVGTLDPDRQGNVFTIHDENNQVNRYNDIFYIETNNADAARARAQLEKDDKDLPTYEEVMRITSAANSASTSIMAATSTSSVNTTNTIDSTLALPPYSAIFCNDRTGAVNSCERSAALSSPNVASTSTEHTTIALSSSLGFSNTISTQTQTAAPPSSSSNV